MLRLALERNSRRRGSGCCRPQWFRCGLRLRVRHLMKSASVCRGVRIEPQKPARIPDARDRREILTGSNGSAVDRGADRHAVGDQIKRVAVGAAEIAARAAAIRPGLHVL